jgi:hypothetical protein
MLRLATAKAVLFPCKGARARIMAASVRAVASNSTPVVIVCGQVIILGLLPRSELLLISMSVLLTVIAVTMVMLRTVVLLVLGVISPVKPWSVNKISLSEHTILFKNHHMILEELGILSAFRVCL